jgi:hypothetical protein
LPSSAVDDFKNYMSNIFDNYSILDLTIRQTGSVCVNPN